MSRFEINFKQDKQVWDDFVRTSPQRSIFVYSEFLDSLLTGYDLVTCHDNGRIVAGAVVMRSGDGAAFEGPFPFTQYQGVLLADDAGRAMHSQITHEFRAVEYLIAQLADQHVKFSLCHSWRLRDLRPFQWHNYHAPERGMFSIDLRYSAVLDVGGYGSFDQYAQSIRACRRQEARKAAKTLEISYSHDVVALDKLHAMTFARQDIVRPDGESALLMSIAGRAVDGGYGRLGYAMKDGVPIAAILFLHDDRSAYYLVGANDPDHRNTGAASFLMLHMIRDAFENGIREIDFVGVNSPQRGDFKISFNADPKPYFITSIG